MLPPEILPALHADGQRCTIAGYASLMDCESARLTTPSLINFRYGAVEGYARIFNLVSIVNIQRGLATGQHLATATARPSPARAAGNGLQRPVQQMPLSELSASAAAQRNELAKDKAFMLNVVTTLKEQLAEERQARARARGSREAIPQI